MRAVVFPGDDRIEFRDFPDPIPGPDEVVIRIKASGMCGSDLHYIHGPAKSEDDVFIAGHEPCGTIEAVGSAVAQSLARPGDRVMVHHYDGCRQCESCRSGWTQLCLDGRVVYGGPKGHGAHAPYMKAAAHTVIKLPDALSFKAGAAVACGSGTAYGALQRAKVRGEDTVAIFGQGPVGLSCTLFAKAMGARVIALDVGDERLDMARKSGADHVVNPLRDDAVSAIRDLTRHGWGADISIECSSNPGARRQAIQAVRHWGTACFVGVNGPMSFEANDIILHQKTVLGSLTFSKNMQADCADFAVERGIDLDSLFTHEFRLEDAIEAYKLFDQQKIGKGVFLFDG
jgi:threonine dehydrogenase-like Zn-dependent dehydrogenase